LEISPQENITFVQAIVKLLVKCGTETWKQGDRDKKDRNYGNEDLINHSWTGMARQT
jgi:hypothetical protein